MAGVEALPAAHPFAEWREARSPVAEAAPAALD